MTWTHPADAVRREWGRAFPGGADDEREERNDALGPGSTALRAHPRPTGFRGPRLPRPMTRRGGRELLFDDVKRAKLRDVRGELASPRSKARFLEQPLHRRSDRIG